MNNLTTIAQLPMGAGCLSRLDPEVGKSPERPKLNTAELLAAINRIVEQDIGMISDAYRQAIIYGEGWWVIDGPSAYPGPLAEQRKLASLGYKVNAQGTIERL